MSGTDDPALSPTADGSGQAALAVTEGASSGGVSVGVFVPVGTVIDGQYRVDKELGRGGMGAVVLAHDLRLERDVAVKLGTVVSAGALQRVEREAIALAKLQHPNVVVVHQVGKFEGRLYIAMEHVAGGNATQWLAAKPRTWRDIALLYAAAADGLAAAHAAGFIHRDFKPDNVLVGEDDRPRVADFGLVRSTTDSIDPEVSLSSSPALASMTQTGAVMGTPAYMAPEQLAGKPADARADQFSLCASVWEALFGTRPYSGKTPEEIASSIAAATFEIPEGARRVPRRLVAALRRGLSRDPDARWPSLAPLIAELRRDPGRGRRNLMIGVLGAAAVAAAAAVMLLRSAPDPCGDGPAQLARTWNAGRAEDIAAAFSNAHLADSWPSVRAAIDRYGASWTSSYTAACRATRVDGAQSEALLDRRMLCLTRARSRLDSLLADVSAEREAAADAMRSIGALPELAQCADTAAFAQQRALPNDPALRERIERAAKLLDVAQAAVLDTWMKDRITPVETALAAARATGWPPLVAEATWVHGSVLTGDAAIKELLAGASAALAAGDDRIACWAYADAAWQLSDKPAEAERWLAQARGLWARLGQPADLGNRIENADAERLLAAGDVEGALAATRRANELSRRAYPDNRYDRVSEHYDLAHVLDAAGKYDEANAEITLAITDATQLSGASHPHVGQMLPLAAMIAQHAGKLDDALALSRRAVAIAESWYGKDDPRLVAPLAALGQMSVFAGKPDDARAALERALVLDPADGNSTYSLVMLEATTGHQDHGIELATAALARDERDTGVDNVDHLHWLVALGIMHREVGHLADSHRYLERGAKLGAAGLGADAPQTVNAEIELSYTLVAEKRAPEAVKLLEPALGFAQLAPPVAAELHTAFGQAAWETGQHDRARREVRAGRDAYEALGEAFAEQRTGADNWLAKHPS